MPTYTYKATDASGKILRGSFEAEEKKGVVIHLQDMGYIPMRVDLVGKGRVRLDSDVSKIIFSPLTGISTKDIMVFTQDLSTLLGAGLPVDRALSILIHAIEKEKFKEVVREVLRSVQGGGYLSDALSKHPKVFSTFYVNMVKAGETGGVLEDVLSKLGEFLENSQDLKDYIRSAMVYPAFLVLVGGISIIILLTFVIPKFSIIFSDMGQSIPVTTRFLLGFSNILRTYWPLMLGALVGIYFFLRHYFRTPAGRLILDQYKINLPLGGGLIKKIEVARFARTLGTLSKSGVPILQALRLVKDIMSNQIVARAMERIYERVKEGERLSRPLSDVGIFPSLAIQMIMVGEETGRLDEMLLRVADNYEKTVRNIVKRLISFLEPAMILLMGLVVGFIVISMLMAIFSMNEMPF